MQDTYLIVLNPTAGGGRAEKKWNKIAEELDLQRISYHLKRSEYSGHILAIVREAIQQGYRRFIAIGGDGTVNETVNGIFSQTEVPTEKITLTCIPLGTGNDWAKTHRIPTNIKEVIGMIKRQNILIQDIGKISFYKEGQKCQYYFNNVAGIAFDGFAVFQTLSMNKRGAFTKIFYLWLVIKLLWKYKASEFSLQSDTFSYTGNVFCINVGICKYSGGGMQTVPLSVPNDGLFDITIIEAMPRLRLLWEIRRLYTGSVYECPKILHKRTSAVSITAPEPNKDLEADGEWLGYVPVTFEMIPQSLQIIGNY